MPTLDGADEVEPGGRSILIKGRGGALLPREKIVASASHQADHYRG